eukprot:c32362_g1_i1.p1 GENE.c32362_g1_i1~~c32362_g1_i1.p1  ORF type:complete len:242 (+),score=81.49 c32362_g1_i1:42-728(+)
MNLFGGNSARRRTQQLQPSPYDAIQTLNNSLSNLDKREADLQQKADNELITAKRMVAAKNKRAAKLALTRKRMFEAQLEKIVGIRMTIEQQKLAIESNNFNLEIFNVLRVGASALQSINQDLSVDRVDEVMDQIQDGIDLSTEITDALSQPLSSLEDEDELEAELAALQADEFEATLLNVDDDSTRTTTTARTTTTTPVSSIDFPIAPRNQIGDEEEELRRLEAEMAY